MNGGVWICWISDGRSRSLPVLPRRRRGRSRQACVRGCAAVHRRRRATAGWSRCVDARSASSSASSPNGRRRRGERAAEPRPAARRGCPACRSAKSAAARKSLDARAVLARVRQPLLPRLGLLRRQTRPATARRAAPRPRRSRAGSPAAQASETSAAGCRDRPWDRWR